MNPKTLICGARYLLTRIAGLEIKSLTNPSTKSIIYNFHPRTSIEVQYVCRSSSYPGEYVFGILTRYEIHAGSDIFKGLPLILLPENVIRTQIFGTVISNVPIDRTPIKKVDDIYEV